MYNGDMLQNYSNIRNEVKKVGSAEPSLAFLFFEISKFTGRYKRKGDFLFDEMHEVYVLWGKWQRQIKTNFFMIANVTTLLVILLILVTELTKSFQDSIFEFSVAESSLGTTQNLVPRLVQSPF